MSDALSPHNLRCREALELFKARVDDHFAMFRILLNTEPQTLEKLISLLNSGSDEERETLHRLILHEYRVVQSEQNHWLNEAVEMIPVIREFDKPENQGVFYLTTTMRNARSHLKSLSGESGVGSAELARAAVFAKIIDDMSEPDMELLEWISTKLDELRPYAALLRERRRCDRALLEQVISSHAPGLAEGTL